MAAYQMTLRDYQRVLRKRYKIIIFSTLMLAIFSYVFAQQQVPVYSTTSSVKIDDQANNLASTILANPTYNFWDNLATQSEIMKSFDAIEKVAKRLNQIPPDVPSDEVRRNDTHINTIKAIQGMITTQQSGNTNIIDITTTSTNPELARDVANAVAQVFRETHRADKQRQASETSKFIEESIKSTEQRLKTVEDSLKTFQLTMRVPSIATDAQDAIVKYNETEISYMDLTTTIDQIDLELAQLIERRDQGKQLSTQQRSDPAGASLYIDWISSVDQQSQTLAILNNRLVNLELEKMDKLLYYNAEHPDIIDIETQVRSIVSQLIREYTERVKLLRDRKQELEDNLSIQREKLDGLPDAQRKFAKLQRDVLLQENVLQLLLQRQQEVLIRKEDIADDVSIVKFATLSSFPTNANSSQVMFTGMVIGLLLGVVLAFVFETLDTSIGTIEDVEEYLELPVLGIIPHIDIEEMIIEKYPHLENDPQLPYYTRLIALFAPKTPVSESYRTLRTNLSFSGISKDKPNKTLVFTSSSLQEGKSTTLANLAIVTAQQGKRTLLIGCNLRRPSIYKTFGIKRTPGVTDIILGSIPWEDCVQSITDIMVGSFGVPEVLTASGLDNLYIIESGQTPPNPSELLSSPQMEQFIKEASQEFDMVYIDMPPTLPVTDSSILSPKVDGVVLIYQVGRVPRNALKRAKDQLQNVGAHVVGVVLNDVRAEITGFHPATEYFIHYYGEDTGRQQGRLAGIIGGMKEGAQPLRMPAEAGRRNEGRLKRVGTIAGLFLAAAGLAGFLTWQFLFNGGEKEGATPQTTPPAAASSLQFETEPSAEQVQPSVAAPGGALNTPQWENDPGALIPAIVEVPKIGVRSGPGTNYKEIGTVVEGDRVPIVDTQQDWYRINMPDGRVGWIPMMAAAIDTVFR